jgi:hypothetical protein
MVSGLKIRVEGGLTDYSQVDTVGSRYKSVIFKEVPGFSVQINQLLYRFPVQIRKLHRFAVQIRQLYGGFGYKSVNFAEVSGVETLVRSLVREKTALRPSACA